MKSRVQVSAHVCRPRDHSQLDQYKGGFSSAFADICTQQYKVDRFYLPNLLLCLYVSTSQKTLSSHRKCCCQLINMLTSGNVVIRSRRAALNSPRIHSSFFQTRTHAHTRSHTLPPVTHTHTHTHKHTHTHTRFPLAAGTGTRRGNGGTGSAAPPTPPCSPPSTASSRCCASTRASYW